MGGDELSSPSLTVLHKKSASHTREKQILFRKFILKPIGLRINFQEKYNGMQRVVYSAKKWSKALGVAYRIFLSSWPGVLCQLLCHTLHNDLSEYDEIHCTFCKHLPRKQRITVEDTHFKVGTFHTFAGFPWKVFAKMLINHLRAIQAGDASQPKGCSAHFVLVMAINKPDFLAGGVIFL